MNDEELFEKMMRKEITICETCDNIFSYVPQKQFCDWCTHEKTKLRRRKYLEENREKINAMNRNYYQKNREKKAAYDREYREKNREKINAQRRARYHAKKKK